MGLDLLDLIFRLGRRFGPRIFGSAAGSPLYDSAFDPPAVAKQKGGDTHRKTLGASGMTVRVLAGSRCYPAAPSPPGRHFLSPHVARPSTHYDSCPTRRLSSDGTTVVCPITSTLFTNRRGSSRVPGRQSFIREGTARISASAVRTSCSEQSPVGYSSSMVFLGREGAFDHRSMGRALSRRTQG